MGVLGLTNDYWVEQVKENEVGAVCSTSARDRNHTYLEGGYQFGYLYRDG
jgi:hypothetical protein